MAKNVTSSAEPQEKPRVKDRHFPLLLLDNPFRRLLWPPKKLLSKYVSRGMVVADLGCGSGYHTLPMAQIVGPEGKVYATDSDDRAVRALLSKAARQRLENVDARASSASELGFIPTNSVDFVLANGLLCCMVDHAGAVREIKRILKPAGSIYMSIRKGSSKNDPRRLSNEEWLGVLERFEVVEQDEGLTRRSAYAKNKFVSKMNWVMGEP